MSASRPFFPPRARVFVGGLTLLTVIALTYLRARAVEGPLETLAHFESQRDAGQVSEAGLASAQYHAAHARDAIEGRWRFSGYALQGVLGAVLGLSLVATGLRARTG